MAWDEGLAELLRGSLEPHPIVEKRMFGGLAFLLNGHMVCGVHKGGAMVRVGKDNYDEALAIVRVEPMMFTGKPMSGMVDVSDEACADDTRRGQLVGMGLKTVLALEPKQDRRR